MQEYMLGQAGVDCEEQGRRTVSTLVFEINSTEAKTLLKKSIMNAILLERHVRLTLFTRLRLLSL